MTMVKAGSREWKIALLMKRPVPAGDQAAGVALADGEDVQTLTASSHSSIRARKKYGSACTNIRPGSSRSSQPPCRHPAKMPSNVPRKKAITVAVPTRASVHGIVWASSDDTDAG